MTYKMKGFSGYKSPLKKTKKEQEALTKKKWIEEQEKMKPFKEEWHKDYFYNKAKYEKPGLHITPDEEDIKKSNIA